MISCGLNIMLFWYFARSLASVATRRSERDNAVATANFTTPASIRSKIPSCNTSEATTKSLNFDFVMPLNTALATDPTPDCNGAKLSVKRPSSTSFSKNERRLSAMAWVSSLGSKSGDGISGSSERIIPLILSGLTRMPFSPICLLLIS